MVFNYLSPDLSENDDDSSQLSLPSSPSFTVCVPAGGISPGALPVAGRVTEDASLEFPAPPVDASFWSREDSSDALHLQSHRPQEGSFYRCFEKVQMVEIGMPSDRVIVEGVVDYVYKRMGKRALILTDEEKKPSSFSNAMDGSPSVGTSTIAGADDRSQLEMITNAFTQTSSLEAPIPLLLPASERGQATGSRSSPANQNDYGPVWFSFANGLWDSKVPWPNENAFGSIFWATLARCNCISKGL